MLIIALIVVPSSFALIQQPGLSAYQPFIPDPDDNQCNMADCDVPIPTPDGSDTIFNWLDPDRVICIGNLIRAVGNHPSRGIVLNIGPPSDKGPDVNRFKTYKKKCPRIVEASETETCMDAGYFFCRRKLNSLNGIPNFTAETQRANEFIYDTPTISMQGCIKYHSKRLTGMLKSFQPLGGFNYTQFPEIFEGFATMSYILFFDDNVAIDAILNLARWLRDRFWQPSFLFFEAPSVVPVDDVNNYTLRTTSLYVNRSVYDPQLGAGTEEVIIEMPSIKGYQCCENVTIPIFPNIENIRVDSGAYYVTTQANIAGNEWKNYYVKTANCAPRNRYPAEYYVLPNPDTCTAQ